MSGRVFSASSNAVWYTRMFRAVGCAGLREGMEEGSTAIIMIQAQVELGSGEREYDGMEEERYHYSVLLTG